MKVQLPFLIGMVVAGLLYFYIGWWGFLIIFPWIGFSITTGIYLSLHLPAKKKNLGRKTATLMILPMLLLFVPVVNNENFQLEGVVLLVMGGFFQGCYPLCRGQSFWSHNLGQRILRLGLLDSGCFRLAAR